MAVELPSSEQKCVRCANGDTRTADGFHLMSAGHYRRCADLPPYEQPATPSSNQYLSRKAQLENDKCEKCVGLGELNDSDFGDMYYNEWQCPDCKGSGLKPSAVETSTDVIYMSTIEPQIDRIKLDGRIWMIETVRAALKAYGRTFVSTVEPADDGGPR